MDTDQNWYRQLMALLLLSASRTAIEFITNPQGREDATKQFKGALAEIDYDALAKAATSVLDNLADTSKTRLTETIDTLHGKTLDAVDTAKGRAAKQLAPEEKGTSKTRLVFALLVGGVIAYFLLDEQRRDDLLDRLTGASGPIQQTTQSVYQQAASAAQQAVNKAPEPARDAAQQAADATQETADQAKSDTQA